ncbi:hypothetical protein F9C07_2231911 [Aspergillus flavus]|uniref:Xylanolytic transcriptional activator regulatory domain-containing protein n=1 Tax=Aspergillus flavus (strain ATCC 200026 / FGSC A1120 / IAM 13836 / NRRL 3357 / JCM 12722 / SRRC 167) TaxID=332952 RepID=A0A7U2MT66_ASPFN|nr:uncharacterized protein G4B84_005951 [Aspergillus flavus NRRL3357]QMW30570.1 hypothetical protein G4B84_005951 [Aspergillus flavus NRRL3357]QRD89449.1 hypothetical protein F9C07_2231911 [Aspergillus flavus]
MQIASACAAGRTSVNATSYFRLNRVCCYTEPNGITGPGDSPEDVSSISLPVPDLAQLTSDNIAHTIRTQVFTIIGDESRIRAVAAVYFRTIHPWFPILAEGPFYERLTYILTYTSADLSLLTLCMVLLGAKPVDDEIPPRMRSLYILLKGFIATLEAIEINSLELLQCRLLLTIFEVGHGMYPAAYISMGANVRAAVALGANEVSKAQLEETFKSPGRAGEARRIWRGIVIADRYVSLESNKGPIIPKALLSGAVGGNDDSEAFDPTLTPSKPLYHFNKLAQASRILEQVLTHVHDPVQHMEFFNAEAIQILKTLSSFRETVQEDYNVPHDLCCSAVAISRSALMTILEFGYSLKAPGLESCAAASYELMQDVIGELVYASESFAAQITPADLEVLPVFVVHSVYKAARLLLGVLRDSPKVDSRRAVSVLEKVLQCMSTRWVTGQRYLDDLKRQKTAS